ncbi:MAG TPA: oxygen-dependent coproporphyrinogen oxidase, partial [Gemmatimonadales bacterium]|nr:oxygen-dependent coproporphyrinogen oxidase [Gemmatimonadales bacterium]
MSAVLTRAEIAATIESLHDDATRFFSEADDGRPFREDVWQRPGGGGGVSRVLAGGAVFEKCGVNRSVVEGVMPAQLARRVGAQAASEGESAFFVAGVSIVAHPRSPKVPTVHLNVRYFEIATPDGAVADAWFGGGTDLTPTYPYAEDATHFHRALKAMADRHHPSFYSRFKTWCDNYFVNLHRGEERRGVGGIFFDHLRPGDSGLDARRLLDFLVDVGRALPAAYGPIVRRRRDEPYGERERRFQLARRGRYVEFNLVHDRGTLFGLQTNARIESVLMSLPPLAAWEYSPTYEPGSFEAELLAMLEPRDWIA